MYSKLFETKQHKKKKKKKNVVNNKLQKKIQNKKNNFFFLLLLLLPPFFFVTHIKCIANSSVSSEAFGQFSNESLILLAWVANWRPIEIFLYDWLPLLRRRNLYRLWIGGHCHRQSFLTLEIEAMV